MSTPDIARIRQIAHDADEAARASNATSFRNVMEREIEQAAHRGQTSFDALFVDNESRYSTWMRAYIEDLRAAGYMVEPILHNGVPHVKISWK